MVLRLWKSFKNCVTSSNKGKSLDKTLQFWLFWTTVFWSDSKLKFIDFSDDGGQSLVLYRSSAKYRENLEKYNGFIQICTGCQFLYKLMAISLY